MSRLVPGAAFSADTDRVDRAQVHAWLSGEAYWAIGRSRATQDAAIDGSRNYGVYRSGRQIAYARAVTDRVTFAWVCDVFVDASERGRGVGRMLVEGLTADLDAFGLKRMVLTTGDAHGLYAAVGFEALPSPERWMVRPGSSPA